MNNPDLRDLKAADDERLNRDPISGTPGAHPVGVGIGAALGGASAGALAGTIVGPVGTVVGAAVGAIVGGLAGKGVAEKIDPTVEEAYWRENYRTRPYVDANTTYEDIGPAYQYGVSAKIINPDRTFDEVHDELKDEWHNSRGASTLNWDSASHATRDAWDRIDNSRL